MADIEITVDGGTSKRLLTAGKYCDKNILVTATGGGGQPEPPDDGKTRLYITVPANSMPGLPPPRNEVPLYIQQSVANGVTIDWGDGSDPETLPGTGNVHTTHTYQQAGDFVISLDPAEGCELGFGHGISGYSVLGSMPNEIVYLGMLKKVVVGNRGIKSIGESAFENCFGLSSIIIPSTVETIETAAFNFCYNFPSIIIPNGIKSIGESAFTNCYSLSSAVISRTVETIGAWAFRYCYGAKEYHLLSEIPPVIEGNAIFFGAPTDCIIYVPIGSLEAYQTAPEWTSFADQIQEEPA